MAAYKITPDNSTDHVVLTLPNGSANVEGALERKGKKCIDALIYYDLIANDTANVSSNGVSAVPSRRRDSNMAKLVSVMGVYSQGSIDGGEEEKSLAGSDDENG